MKPLMLLLILSFVQHSTAEKGCSGIYFIKGIAYDEEMNCIKNQTLLLTSGKSVYEFDTNNQGAFRIEVPWRTACPSNRTKGQHRADNDQLNSKQLFISLKEIEITINNRWKTYGKCWEDDEEKTTWKRDLIFK